MSDHFIWGFSLQNYHPWPALPSEPSDVKWESRYFWPSNQTIRLSHMPESLLSLAEYRFKTSVDTYILKNETNIKLRRHKLHVKQLIEQDESCACYAKKIKVPLENASDILSELGEWDHSCPLEDYLRQTFQLITVKKERLIHQINAANRLELSRIEIGSNHYLSLCLESATRAGLETLIDQIKPAQKAQTYIEFLKTC